MQFLKKNKPVNSSVSGLQALMNEFISFNITK